MVGFISTDAETDLLLERNESASVEKTVAVYRQTPNADVEAHRKPFAASAEQSMSALITISIPAAR